MIQFNLLPDIKIQYLRSRRQKHLVLLGSMVTVAVSIVIMIVLISLVFVVQKKSVSDLNKDIASTSKELRNTPNLTKIQTVQNQLRSLPALHDAKPVASRIFGFITQSTPAAVSIARLNADFDLQTVTVSGLTDTLKTVNTFADTLKFTTYHTAKKPKDEIKAFSEVVLSTQARDTSGAAYTITFKFDPLIFSELEDITLVVPQTITTRSSDKTSPLFQDTEDGAQQ